mmetsp:Transcript_18876/g.51953  ORF Transcript_18876/g.51953 Transcript_18876/m.51953 type:complete len:378 (+) Transcript_18876:555-1688(+)
MVRSILLNEKEAAPCLPSKLPCSDFLTTLEDVKKDQLLVVHEAAIQGLHDRLANGRARPQKPRHVALLERQRVASRPHQDGFLLQGGQTVEHCHEGHETSKRHRQPPYPHPPLDGRCGGLLAFELRRQLEVELETTAGRHAEALRQRPAPPRSAGLSAPAHVRKQRGRADMGRPAATCEHPTKNGAVLRMAKVKFVVCRRSHEVNLHNAEARAALAKVCDIAEEHAAAGIHHESENHPNTLLPVRVPADVQRLQCLVGREGCEERPVCRVVQRRRRKAQHAQGLVDDQCLTQQRNGVELRRVVPRQRMTSVVLLRSPRRRAALTRRRPALAGHKQRHRVVAAIQISEDGRLPHRVRERYETLEKKEVARDAELFQVA